MFEFGGKRIYTFNLDYQHCTSVYLAISEYLCTRGSIEITYGSSMTIHIIKNIHMRNESLAAIGTYATFSRSARLARSSKE